MKKKIRYAIIVLLIIFILLEILVRLIGSYDQNDNFKFRKRYLSPLALPIQSVSTILEDYKKTPSKSFIQYDSLIGWIPSYNFVSEDGWYAHERNGIRVLDSSNVIDSNNTKFRIALFGDSYIYGDEVPFQGTIGAQLQALLDTNSEILNFGIGGGGMDQALLRLKHQGKYFNPDVILFGFQPENVMRNGNIFRSIYNLNAGIPFTKPRFTKVKDEFQLINYPTMKPHQIVDSLKLGSLKSQDVFFDQRFEQSFYHSKLISLMHNIMTLNRFNYLNEQKAFYTQESQSFETAFHILSEFQKTADSLGAKFLILHLPRKLDLIHSNQGELIYQDMLSKIKDEYLCVDPEQSLRNNEIDELFRPKQHYSSFGNGIIAQKIHSSILK
ncbi:MAG: SGNH/GDSL hydrolase family protein [Flavobacteriales bacterium]|nr:SGNH/GDSL hydrolase family protein [Flavobacteriales bacterium]